MITWGCWTGWRNQKWEKMMLTTLLNMQWLLVSSDQQRWTTTFLLQGWECLLRPLSVYVLCRHVLVKMLVRLTSKETLISAVSLSRMLRLRKRCQTLYSVVNRNGFWPGWEKILDDSSWTWMLVGQRWRSASDVSLSGSKCFSLESLLFHLIISQPLDLMSLEYRSAPVLQVPADSISWQHITVSGPPPHRSDRCNYLCPLWLRLQHNDVVTTDVSVKQTSSCVLEMLALQFTADHTSPCSSSLKLL